MVSVKKAESGLVLGCEPLPLYGVHKCKCHHSHTNTQAIHPLHPYLTVGTAIRGSWAPVHSGGARPNGDLVRALRGMWDG